MTETASAGQPRHIALAATLADEIGAAAYPVGGRFPTEADLRARFGVGRHTVREALKILTEQGLIGRRRKTGTVVLAARPFSHYAHSLRDLKGLLDFAESTVLDIRYESFVSTADRAPDELAGLPDKRWLRLAGVRRRRGDGQLLCWAEIYVPDRFAPEREGLRGSERAVYEQVMARHGLRLEYVEQSVTAVALPGPIAALLEADPESPALRVVRRYVAHTGATFELSQNLYPAGRYSMRSLLRQRA
ncbi:Trehalose operon transcriptional repressor [bacterium YEK0313]|nr:Trehalose operon transcriptional repressor [bacterium YEK0313]